MMKMAETMIGVVKNGVIVLPKGAKLPEGTKVEIRLPQKLRLLKHFGVWKERTDLDGLLKEIYDSRERNFGREVKW